MNCGRSLSFLCPIAVLAVLQITRSQIILMEDIVDFTIQSLETEIHQHGKNGFLVQLLSQIMERKSLLKKKRQKNVNSPIISTSLVDIPTDIWRYVI